MDDLQPLDDSLLAAQEAAAASAEAQNAAATAVDPANLPFMMRVAVWMFSVRFALARQDTLVQDTTLQDN